MTGFFREIRIQAWELPRLFKKIQRPSLDEAGVETNYLKQGRPQKNPTQKLMNKWLLLLLLFIFVGAIIKAGQDLNQERLNKFERPVQLLID